jgi:hypothetical protein
MEFNQKDFIIAVIVTGLIVIGLWIFIKLAERSIRKNPEKYFADGKLPIEKDKT